MVESEKASQKLRHSENSGNDTSAVENATEDSHDTEKSCDEENNESETLNRLKRDLHLTQQILIQNPKSYSTWAHRRLVLELIKKLDQTEGENFAKPWIF